MKGKESNSLKDIRNIIRALALKCTFIRNYVTIESLSMNLLILFKLFSIIKYANETY